MITAQQTESPYLPSRTKTRSTARLSVKNIGTSRKARKTQRKTQKKTAGSGVRKTMRKNRKTQKNTAELSDKETGNRRNNISGLCLEHPEEANYCKDDDGADSDIGSSDIDAGADDCVFGKQPEPFIDAGGNTWRVCCYVIPEPPCFDDRAFLASREEEPLSPAALRKKYEDIEYGNGSEDDKFFEDSD